MIKDLINELKAIDERLVPDRVDFYDIKYNSKFVKLDYFNEYGISVKIHRDETFFINYGNGEGDTVLFCNKRNCGFDLVMLLHNNQDKMIKILLKYL